MARVSYTREQMEEVIRQGGSVLHQGRVISHPDHLPPPEELAAGNADEEAAVASALRAQRDAIDRRLAGLPGGATPGTIPRSDAGTDEAAAGRRSRQGRTVTDAGTGDEPPPLTPPAEQSGAGDEPSRTS